MADFKDLKRKDNYLYRGSHGDPAKAVMSLAVGPVGSVAKHIAEHRLDVPNPVRPEVEAFFSKALLGRKERNRFDTLADHLDYLLSVTAYVGNHYTGFEHVMYESEAQINSVHTGNLLESVSSNPQVGVLYAYGICPDPWFSGGKVEFWREKPNSNSFIAVLLADKILDKRKVLNSLASIATPSGLTMDEAERRMRRDSEELIEMAVKPSRIIMLPDFDEADPTGFLDRAAEILQTENVAD